MSEPRCQIMLVEDAEADVFLVREALELSGLKFELLVLDNGEKAVDFINRLDRDEHVPRPNLLLLDLNLPRKSGGQVLEHVRQSRTCGQIPVVILTSSDSAKDRSRAAALGAKRYFRKSFSLEEFMRLGPLVRELLHPKPAG